MGCFEKSPVLQSPEELLRLFREHRGRMLRELKLLYLSDERKYSRITENLLDQDREFREYYYYDLAFQMHLSRWKRSKERRLAWKALLRRLGLGGTPAAGIG